VYFACFAGGTVKVLGNKNKEHIMENTITLYYFTGTGNSLFIAKTVQQALVQAGKTCELVDISQSEAANIKTHNITIGFVFPVYGLGFPNIAKAFLKNFPKQQNGTFFVVCNAHSNPGKTTSFTEKIMTAKGYRMLGALHTFTPSSSIITEATESEEQAAEMRQTAAKKATAFVASLLNGEHPVEYKQLNIKETFMAVMFKVMMPGVIIKKWSVDENCKSCKKCVKICPVQNLELIEGTPVWGKNCQVCLRCLNFCPSNAIQLMDSPGRSRYREPSFRP
jgi:ferredoxin